MIDVDKLFSYESTANKIKEISDYISKTFVKPQYSSIPKEYYPYLYKLLSYRKYDDRGKYKEGDIKTFFVGKTEYGNYSIMFYDNNGYCDSIGCIKAISEWSKEKNLEWENMRGVVIQVLRNIARFSIIEKQNSIIFPITCEISGKTLSNISECHIDHYNKDFAEVTYDWLYNMKILAEKHNNKLVDIIFELYKLIDDNKKYFKDKNWNRSFKNYHDSHTHLRVVSKEANLKREKAKPNWEYLKINGCYIEKYAKESNI